MLHRQLQKLKVPVQFGVLTCPCIPREVVLPRLLQHLHVPIINGRGTYG